MNVGFLERVDKTNEMMGRATGPDLSLNPEWAKELKRYSSLVYLVCSEFVFRKELRTRRYDLMDWLMQC